MEKLKPLLIYRFWIILVVVLILPPIGWWMASGKLKAEIDKRIGELDSVIKGIPQGQGVPNDDWANQAQKLVETRKIRNELALKVLWDSQVKTRVWPAPVAKYMAKCPYRGELTDRNDREKVPDLYRDSYQDALEQVWRIPFPKQDLTDPNRPQIVDFPFQRLPRVPANTWRGIVPTWPEIWTASEDLWLLEQLLLAVQRSNSVATNLADAHVKQIEAIELFGGKRLGPAEAPAAAAGMSGGMPGMNPGVSSGGATAAAATPAATSAEFNIAEEYQVTGKPTGGGGPEGPGPGVAVFGNSQPAAGTPANPDEGRYIQDTPAFRTRGFKIKVIVRQQNAMEFVRELLNSQYPTEITRMQQFVLNPPFGGGTGGGGFGGAFGNPMGGLSGGPSSGFEGFAPGGGGGGGLTGSGDLGGGVAIGGPGGGVAIGGIGGGGGDTTGPSGALSGASPQDALVYQDPHLVSLVIIGEMYIYKEPKLPEAAPADPNAPATAAPGEVAAPATTQPVDDASGAPAQTPAAQPTESKPADPAASSTETPEGGTAPAGAKSPDGQPGPVKGGTPAPAKTETPKVPEVKDAEPASQ